MNIEVSIFIKGVSGDEKPLSRYMFPGLSDVPVVGDTVTIEDFGKAPFPAASVVGRQVTLCSPADESMASQPSRCRLVITFQFMESLKSYLRYIDIDGYSKECSNRWLKSSALTVDDIMFIADNPSLFGLSEPLVTLLRHYLWKVSYGMI